MGIAKLDLLIVTELQLYKILNNVQKKYSSF